MFVVISEKSETIAILDGIATKVTEARLFRSILGKHTAKRAGADLENSRTDITICQLAKLRIREEDIHASASFACPARFDALHMYDEHLIQFCHGIAYSYVHAYVTGIWSDIWKKIDSWTHKLESCTTNHRNLMCFQARKYICNFVYRVAEYASCICCVQVSVLSVA